MAAILCKTVGDLITQCCGAMRIPCQACGKGCNELGKLMCTPFMPYLVVTFGLNTPAVVYGVRNLLNIDCSPSLFRWLVVNASYSVCHMVAAMYIVKIIRAPAPTPAQAATVSATTGLKAAEEGTANNFYVLSDQETSTPGGPNSFQRIKHVLCYDKGMAVYIVIFLSWIIWMGMGVSRRFSDDSGCDDMLHSMNVAISLGYVWMSMVGMAFCCSLCCLR